MEKEYDNEVRAKILLDALPYIQKYRKKIVVIKYGGNAMINEELKIAVMRDICLLNLVGIRVVLVHGGGPEINEMLEKVGKESKFINGLRYTDEETMEIVQMVLCGKVNKKLVSLLQTCGGKAIGLCGIDGGLLKAKKFVGDEDLGLVGKVTDVNVDPIMTALDEGFIPVIATVGMDDEGNSYNINADTAAAKIANALGAENFILMTDIVGLLRDINDESSLISQVKVSEVDKLFEEKIISGGMIPKIECCIYAVENNVVSSCIIDGRKPHSILIEMLTNRGIGTLFIKD